METIVFPDVEALLVTHLSAELALLGDTATVHDAVPNPRPDRFVVAPRLGGVARNLVIDEATIGFEIYAPTQKQAHDLCQLVRAIVRAMAGRVIADVTVGAVGDISGVARFSDPTSDQPRYIYTASVQCRGVAI